MAEVSRQVLASLLVLFIVLSIVGTWSTLSYLTSIPPSSPVQQPPVTQGKVSLFVAERPEPVSTGGIVSVYVP